MIWGGAPYQCTFYVAFMGKRSKTSVVIAFYLMHQRPLPCATVNITTVCSVQFSRSVMSNSLWPHESQHARPPSPSPTPGVHSNSCALSQWCHPAISSSVILFSSCPQSLPTSGSFPMSRLFKWPKYWSFRFSSVLPMNIQGWFPLGWTGLISLLSKGLSRVFSSTTVQRHQFFGSQPFFNRSALTSIHDY